MLKRLNRNTIILTIMFVTVTLDQITKVLARKYISPIFEMSYLGGCFTMRHTENKGAFLSLGAELPDTVRFLIFNVLVAIGLLYILYNLFKDKKMDQLQTIAMSFIIGGGIGNLIDRFFRGSVTDFLNLGIGNLRTGIFNVADMAVTFSAILIAVKMLHEYIQKKSSKSTESDNSKN